MSLAFTEPVSKTEISQGRLRRRLVLATGLPLIVMTVWVGVLLWQIAQLVDTAQWVDHTDQVLSQIHRADGEAAQRAGQVRGFLLTRSPELLNGLEQQGPGDSFRLLAQLTADNPAQLARVREAEQRYQHWWSIAHQAVATAQTGGNPTDVLLTHGIPAERQFRQQVDELRTVEEALRTKRTARQSAVLRRVVLLTSTSAVVLGAFLSLFAWRQLAAVAAGYATTQHALENEAAALREARAELERHADTLQEQVAQRTTELQRANAQLEAFAASISHDLRAPLRGLQGLSQALIEDAGDRLDRDSREYATQILKEAASMDQLIRDLLEFSRLSRANLAVGAVSLQDALDAAIHSVRREIAEQQAHVSIEGPMSVVRANRAVLIQVFANLLSNALKFSTRAPRIVIKVAEQGETVRVWFEDNGIGISPQHHERIFQVFERLHGSEAYPGTGIGLAIVREGVERLGGRVGIESREGDGSRFWVELPHAEAA